MTTGFDWSQFSEAKDQDVDSSFDWSKFSKAEEKPASRRDADRGKFLGGKLGRAYEASQQRPDLITGQIPQALEQHEKSLTAFHDPITSALKQLFGGNKEADIGKGISSKLRGPLSPELEEGAQDITDIEEFLLSLIPVGSAASNLPKPSFGGLTVEGELAGGASKQAGKLLKGPAKMESGLTKLKALEAKRPTFGVLSPERQQKVITGLNKEASELTTRAVDKALPITRQIREGFDFEAKHKQEFGQVKKLADKFDPNIDTAPLDNFLAETGSKYLGIPEPHIEAKKIQREVQAFRRNPQEGMKNLLKIYRSNNKKMQNIFETAHATGKQKEYVDFLQDMNNKIGDSFAATLPEDSAWMKMFRDSNKSFSNYMDSIKVQKSLRPLLHGEATPANLVKYGNNPDFERRLATSMGKEGASEIAQIARDLKSSIEAIKKMPAKEWKAWQKAFPLVGWTIPYVGKLVGAKGMLDVAKRGYGYLLSTPSKRKSYDKLLKSVVSRDAENAHKASNELLQKGPTTDRNKSPQFNLRSGEGATQSPLASSQTSALRSPEPSSKARSLVPSKTPSKTGSSIGTTDPSNKKVILHGSNDSKILLDKASRFRTDFSRELNSLVKDIPGSHLKSVRVKDPTSLEKKLSRAKHKPNQVPDYIGGRIVVDNKQALNNVLNALKSKKPIEIEDFLHKPKNEWGYRAIHVQIPVDGMSGEVQILTKDMARIQPILHRYYKKWSNVPLSQKVSDKKFSSETEKAMRLSKKAYDRFK